MDGFRHTTEIVEALVGEDATLGTVLADAGYWNPAYGEAIAELKEGKAGCRKTPSTDR